MAIVDCGSGPALLLVPGLQGRWEYMRATVEALAASFRVITFSLDADDLDGYAQQAVDAMTTAGVDRAIVCGVSFGGAIALRVASRHAARCRMLVLVSTPPPSLRLRARHRLYLRAPWLLGPLFLAETPFRVRRETRAALTDVRARRRFALDAMRTLAAAPLSMTKMAARARILADDDLTADCGRIAAPTLIVTGEPHLDHVVAVEGTAMYERLIPHARRAVLPDTGHLGSMTRPREFAALVREFVEGHRDAAA
jgi:3-oxoadipate enol-lactonase